MFFVLGLVFCSFPRSYLEIPMHYTILVQVGDGVQHLLNDSAGILLWVNPPLQDTVEEFTAGHTGGNKVDLVTFERRSKRAVNWSEKTSHSQLHDEVVVATTFVEIVHSYDVLMSDSVLGEKKRKRKRKQHEVTVLFNSKSGLQFLATVQNGTVSCIQ